MEGNVEQRQLEFKEFADVLAELDRLHQGGYEKLAQWNLAQVCDHLAYFMEGTLQGEEGGCVMNRIQTHCQCSKPMFTSQEEEGIRLHPHGLLAALTASGSEPPSPRPPPDYRPAPSPARPVPCGLPPSASVPAPRC